jgi:hypothetical protein
MLLLPNRRGLWGADWCREPLWRRAGAKPSWHIAPVRTGTVTDLISGSQIITFTNSSPAWGFNSSGVLVQPTPNVPFIEYDPATGSALGWRVWDAVTNLLLRSEEFTASAWSLFGTASRSANVTTAPSGAVTADSITLPSGSGIFQQVAGSASTAYVFSVWIRSDSNQTARLVINTNLSDATALTVNVTTQWQRLSVTKTTAAGTNAVTAQIDTGGGNTFYVWGAQLNTGPLAPYVPTGALTASSTADVASISGAAFAGIWNQAAWTVYSDSTIAASQIKTQGVWEAAGGTYASSLRQPQGTANQFRAMVGGTFSASPGTGGLLTAGTARAAVAATGATGRLQVGDAGADITSANAPDPTVLWIGNLNSATQLNGYIREMATLKSRRPNANLQAMTQ